MFKAILFDLDGTLLNTLIDLAEAMNASLVYFGFKPHSVEAFKYFVGESVEVEARRALPESARDNRTVKKVAEYSQQIYANCWQKHTKPYPGIPELLDELQHRGLRLAILSNKIDSFTKIMAEKLLPQWRFDVIQGALPGVALKPHPDLALRIVTQLKIPSEQFLYLGDSNIDMRTAVAAGMYPVGCLWGYRTADELLKDGARALISTPAELLKILEAQ
ncbi:MAG: HAD family hydrolase [Sedimentisphaerales bacterium]|nr:HAD family hydrolase [Sedimentisphaerales bacterium]